MVALTLSVILVALALSGAAVEKTKLLSRYHDEVEGTMRTTVTPHGELDLAISGTKTSTSPIFQGGTYEIMATGTHTSWTNVAIMAIYVEGEVSLSAGGDTDDDNDNDSTLNGDEAECTTRVIIGGVLGTELVDVEASASSEHDFYDTELGGWVYLFTSASGGI